MKKIILLLCLLLTLPPAGDADDKMAVPVAAVVSLTGIAASHNAPLLPLIHLAVDDINQQGGLLGHPIRLLLLDNRSTPLGAELAAEKAILNQAVAVIGAHWSSHSMAMAPRLQQARIPMITISTNPDITRVGDYIFRINFNDLFQGRAIARFARRDLGAQRAAILKNLNEIYSMTLGRFFSDTFRMSGGDIVLDRGYKGSAVDFTDLIAQVAQLQPDVLFIPGYARDTGLIINQARAAGVKAVFLGGDAWDDVHRYTGDAVDGSFCTAVWHPRMDTPESRQMVRSFHRHYPEKQITPSAVPWYDAFMLLRDAVNRAGWTAPEKIRDALARTHGFKGAGGSITMDAFGDPDGKEMVILEYDKHTPVFHKLLTPDRTEDKNTL